MTRYLATIFLLTLLLAACSGSGSVTTEVLPSTTATTATTAPPTTSDPEEPIVFGSGSLPDTMPDGFPIPTEAVIGSTLIDRDRNLTEVILRVPAGVEALAGFFDVNLPSRGFEVLSSAGSDTVWDLEFSGEAVTGTIAITLGGQDVAQAVLRVTGT